MNVNTLPAEGFEKPESTTVCAKTPLNAFYILEKKRIHSAPIPFVTVTLNHQGRYSRYHQNTYYNFRKRYCINLHCLAVLLE